jgi:hypothetical protein
MFIRKAGLTKEEIEALKCARREKRSAFLSRMVDEFKKIILIVMYPTVVGFLIWEHIIYEKGVTPAFPSAVTVALITGLFGTIIAYCITSYKEKDSLNKNGLGKDKDGIIQKIASTVATVVTSVTGKTTTTTTDSNDDEAKG